MQRRSALALLLLLLAVACGHDPAAVPDEKDDCERNPSDVTNTTGIGGPSDSLVSDSLLVVPNAIGCAPAPVGERPPLDSLLVGRPIIPPPMP